MYQLVLSSLEYCAFLPDYTALKMYKSLALSTELIGGLLKNFLGSRARYASTLLAQKILLL